jgi:hypothetical protein
MPPAVNLALHEANNNMRIPSLVFLVILCLAAPAWTQTPAQTDSTPSISLFDSIERIKNYLKAEARQNYTDKYLAGVKLHYCEGRPKKGLAWVYSFAFKQPRLGGDISIYHFLDGEIIEFHHGP